ncbi:MAG: hypothetical protein LKI53_08855 [Bacteroidales bacterium]|jgi:hypothetical protein|nr:hypothetical protein [Bacteroidales bacterium]
MGTQEPAQAFLIRDNKHDGGIVPLPGPAPTYSPDIICYQNYLLDYKQAVDTYQEYICRHFLQNMQNNIYIRAKNNFADGAEGEVKAFCSPLSLLYVPGRWTALQTETGETVSKLMKWKEDPRTGDREAVPYSDKGDIILTERPFVKYDVKTPDEHHCILALSRRKGEEWMQLPDKFPRGDYDLWQFLRQHANMAYNNIVIENRKIIQKTVIVIIANHNRYEESYAIRFSVSDGNTFGNCNIGKIRIENTDILCPFESETTPPADTGEAASKAFPLPPNYTGDLIITYFATNNDKPISGTITNEYITLNTSGKIPESCGRGRLLLSEHIKNGRRVAINTDNRIGDFAITFSFKNPISNLKL